MPGETRVIVIGGGAAGFFSAITCAEQLGAKGSVTLLEATAHPLAKVRVSGGGRCNVTHACFEPRELVKRYPDSRYAKDATLRMTYLVNTLANHELHVARYYMKRTAYVAALNRAKYVLETYPDSPAIEEALVIMISAYDALGMDDLKQDTLRVLQTNYPDSPMLGKGVPQDKRVWWKFCESLY